MITSLQPQQIVRAQSVSHSESKIRPEPILERNAFAIAMASEESAWKKTYFSAGF